MFTLASTLLVIKYVIAAAVILVVWAFPAWVARQNKVEDAQMMMIRVSSWGFGWTGFGWLLGLYWAVK
jgi:hypothetical protein